MSYLYQVLAQRVDAWRAANYPCDGYPAIREILEFATEDGEAAQLRYLRQAQFRALETYWYLRLVLGTPKTPELYEHLFEDLPDRLHAMGVNERLFKEARYNYASLIKRVQEDNQFVRDNRLESLRETLTCPPPAVPV
jgi:type III restriction enzyme